MIAALMVLFPRLFGIRGGASEIEKVQNSRSPYGKSTRNPFDISSQNDPTNPYGYYRP